MRRVVLVASAFALLTSYRPSAEISASLLVTYLRCEYLVNPAGLDVLQPRLSWVLEPGDRKLRSQRQTAYQVLVATTSERLGSDQGDVWDTGKVPSDQTIGLQYAGKPLHSKEQYFWKVRVWDEHDRPSSWSETASWSMGLLDKSEWAAKWISDPTAVTTPQEEAEAIRGVNSGYRTQLAPKPDAKKWVVIDLDQPQWVDAVRLFPAYPYEWQPGGPAYSYPVRFRIETANRADFSDAAIVADQTKADVVPPLMNGGAPTYRFTPVQARYVRLFVTRLHAENELFSGFTLAEMEVLA
ncbi:MAG TPA: hypothetical protein VMG82_02525, partial [Candidatus Sulfotelmatobacter sp.]|nr:hypothetical protein [Candidatus Sulfotelmatobacter sp.]